jgi:uncharacterized repeat protein (TIGR04138 family)
MEEKKDFYLVIDEICSKDFRYKPDAYEFVMQALNFTQKRLKKETHVSGKELLEGVREFAIQEYGPMVLTVFGHWGVSNTEDFGNIVFNLVDKKILSKTDSDSINDFKGAYDFQGAFGSVLRDSVIKSLEQMENDTQKDN